MGTRTGTVRPDDGLPANAAGSGNNTGPGTDGGPCVEREYSGSDQDSDSGEDSEAVGSGGGPWAGPRAAHTSGVLSGASSGACPRGAGVKAGKKTRGRVKIKMEFIDNKLRRYTTFSKRKTGIMKKAYELSTLTGTQVLLLVASETGHVYTFATRKLQPMITSETGKALIQTCLNSPDSPPRSDPSSDRRMSASGFEETDLTYQTSDADGASKRQVQTIQVQASSRQTSTNQSSPDTNSPASSSAGLPVSSSSPVAGHMMYPGHAQSHDPAAVSQLFLGAQIPVSAVQLHPMVISGQVVSLDVHQSKDD